MSPCTVRSSDDLDHFRVCLLKWLPVTQQAARSWTFSNLMIFFWVWGFQTCKEYVYCTSPDNVIKYKFTLDSMISKSEILLQNFWNFGIQWNLSTPTVFRSPLGQNFKSIKAPNARLWNARPQRLIIGKPISQYASYSAMFCPLHSSIGKEQHEKHLCNPSSHYGE